MAEERSEEEDDTTGWPQAAKSPAAAAAPAPEPPAPIGGIMGGGDGGGGKYDKWAVHQSQLEAKKMSSPSKPAKAAAALWGEKDKTPGGDGRGDWSHCVWRSVGSVVYSNNNPNEKGIILTQNPLVVVSGLDKRGFEKAVRTWLGKAGIMLHLIPLCHTHPKNNPENP